MLSLENPRWERMGLRPEVRDVLTAKGITSFTPVQGEAFEPIMNGRDVIGRSRTGTGKTLGETTCADYGKDGRMKRHM